MEVREEHMEVQEETNSLCNITSIKKRGCYQIVGLPMEIGLDLKVI